MDHIETANAYSNENCTICREELISGSLDIHFLQCLHKFHMPCITKWLTMKQLCPICKFPSEVLDIVNISEDGKYITSTGDIIDNGIIYHMKSESSYLLPNTPDFILPNSIGFSSDGLIRNLNNMRNFNIQDYESDNNGNTLLSHIIFNNNNNQ